MQCRAIVLDTTGTSYVHVRREINRMRRKKYESKKCWEECNNTKSLCVLPETKNIDFSGWPLLHCRIYMWYLPQFQLCGSPGEKPDIRRYSTRIKLTSFFWLSKKGVDGLQFPIDEGVHGPSTFVRIFYCNSTLNSRFFVVCFCTRERGDRCGSVCMTWRHAR